MPRVLSLIVIGGGVPRAGHARQVLRAAAAGRRHTATRSAPLAARGLPFAATLEVTPP